ncbi:hypothetical protein [Pseudobacteroides cellulosolvens]|uniref:Dockerin domain-containing protein n=1 Tax=Pseudobacteroides cellulosolvens ATCC 35603 = DSM 2933 TaxID=398512 RepID=A0A0L6JSH6_9FIRM|nr:hypothetical protein [Pseudobacteroides cellulosolvens]KNY28781.1 hypothetical protein Bccel_4055 [Pseudobacteroides cellulosolvens ATCC 35603 = DSM 2933]
MRKTLIAVVVFVFLTGLLGITQNAYAEENQISEQTIISGRILKPDGMSFEMQEGTYLGVRLKYFNSNSEYGLTQVPVNEDGTYELAYELASGEYELVVLIEGKNIPYVNSLPDPIQVTSGQKYNKDLKLSYPEISGRVLTKEGTPLEIFKETYVDVELGCTANQDFRRLITVSNDGCFNFGGGLPSGEYYLKAIARGDCKYLYSEIINIDFQKGNKVTKDISLGRANATGRILKPDGTLYKPEGYAYSLIYFDKVGENTFGQYQTGGMEGYYNFGLLPDEGDYICRLIPMGDDNPYAASEPVVVHLSPDKTVVQDLVYTSPMLEGKVLSPDGKSLGDNVAGIEVELRSTEAPHKLQNKVSVNRDGSYRIGGVPTGDYILKAINNDVFYSPYTDSVETRIRLDEKSGIAVKDINLSKPQIRVCVYNTDGMVLTVEENYFIDVSLKNVDGRVEKSLCQTAGTFNLGGFPEGDYYMEIKSFEHEYIKSEKVKVHLTPGELVNLNMFLKDISKKVTGTINTNFEASSYNVLRDFKVEIEGTEISTFTNSQGNFVIPMAPDNSKSYTFVISKDGYLIRKIKNVVVSDDIRLSVNNGPIIMYGGEIIKDGIINLADIMEFVKRFAKQVDNESADKACDLDNDGCINLKDIMIAANNFNKSTDD